jgi:hypothetical protein
VDEAVVLRKILLPKVVVKVLVKEGAIHVQQDGINIVPGKDRKNFLAIKGGSAHHAAPCNE